MRLHRLTRPPIQPSSRTPVLVMLHGLGSNEQDLMGLASQLDPRLHLVSFRAPRAYGPGYSWFDIQWDGSTIKFDEKQAKLALDLLLAELEDLPRELKLEDPLLYVGGFSQGAAMTTAILGARPIEGALVLSGRMSKQLVMPQIPGTPVLIQHGLYDNVIPVESGRRIREVLENAGAAVTYKEYPMGHEVSYESLLDLGRWIGERLPG